ncbi:MAG: cytochrome ubiquinol oxidase subunit I [Rhodospirillaceae bacterium]|jgi:cytochrome d ubiquinol oxidase subunit I|nr:cytochrome ubiquinol oxidase subunit I [Rhodospirillaceae bacterium]
MELDPLLLSRVQFAFVVTFHIIFPSFTIGLASYLAVLEAAWLKTGDEDFKALYHFWTKVFAVSFGMGVVSGIVMSYQFGTNWSRFSDIAGNILGPLLNYEVLTAFFLEAGFLGIMLFGWGRVSRRVHFFATLMVAFGTLLSVFWIIAANSWMHTPAGYEIRDGIFIPVDWVQVIFNPSFPYRFVHMVFAAFLTTSFVVCGVAAWDLVEGRFIRRAKIMLGMGIGTITVLAPLQIVAGDLHGINVLEHQPAKIAAMEGHWETKRGAPFVVFAIPDSEAETNHLEVAIPKLGSFILTRSFDGEVKGLKEWAKEDRPPVFIVFWAFRVMIGIGSLMVVVGVVGAYLAWRRRLFDTRWFLQLCRLASPAGFIAIIAGWFTAEVGRQPYVVYGLVRTADAVSPVTGGSVATSLLLFFLTYVVIFTAAIYYLLGLLRKGPVDAPAVSLEDRRKRPARPLSAVEEKFGMGD